MVADVVVEVDPCVPPAVELVPELSDVLAVVVVELVVVELVVAYALVVVVAASVVVTTAVVACAEDLLG